MSDVSTKVLTPADLQHDAFHKGSQARREAEGIALWQRMDKDERATVLATVEHELSRLLSTTMNWLPASVGIGLNQLEITLRIPLHEIHDVDARDRLRRLMANREGALAELLKVERSLRERIEHGAD